MNETENIAYDINGMFTVEENNREDTSQIPDKQTTDE